MAEIARLDTIFGVVRTRCPPGFRMRLISDIMCIGSAGKVLDQLAAEHRIEVFVRIREGVLLGVEEIDLALERLAVFRLHGLAIGTSEFAVVASTHLAITEFRFERRRDLQV